MRVRRALVLSLVFVAACSTPRISLTPSYRLGDAREYRLHTTATTTIEVGGQRQVQRTELVARSHIDVLEIAADSAKLRLTLTPESFRRDGALQNLASQEAVFVVGLDGDVRSIQSIGGLPPEVTGTRVD